MKKRITITIECETNKENEFIEKTLRRGTYRALDTEPSYISTPSNVDSIEVKIENLNEFSLRIDDTIETVLPDYFTGIGVGERGKVVSIISGYPKIKFDNEFPIAEDLNGLVTVDPIAIKKVEKDLVD